MDAGVCFIGSFVGASGAGQVYCYANGVHEIHTAVDGGTVVTITTPDGQTACYQVVVDQGGAQHYETPAGQEFATLTPTTGNTSYYNVTCDGMTVAVDINDPGCATQNGSACTSNGACP